MSVAVALLAGGLLIAIPASETVSAAGTAALVPLEPARLLETRKGLKTIDGQAQGGGKVGARGVIELKVTDRGGVPGNADAVMLNVTAVGPLGAGYLTAFPCGSVRPVASNVNYSAGAVVANAVLAKVGDGGKVCIFSLAASDVLVDVNGYVPEGGSLKTVEPARLLETRKGLKTYDGQAQGGGKVGARGVIELKVTDRGGVPGNADAVMLNVTAVGPLGAGYLTAFPCGSVRPVASNVNYSAGDVVPNAVLAKVGDGGKVCIFSLAASDVLVDVNGYVPKGGSLITVDPARLGDSRVDGETIDGQGRHRQKIVAEGFQSYPVVYRGPIPGSAEAVMLNVTVVGPAAPGFLTVYPCGADRPLASNVNYGPGDVVPNAVLAKVGDGGAVCIFSKAEADVVVDVSGYVPTSVPPVAAPDCSTSNASQAECDALTAIFNSMSGSIWRFTGNWGTDTDPCTWKGVTCGANGVVDLRPFSGMSPSGPLPPEVGDLTQLTSLAIAGITLVPPEIGGLTKLTTLSLEGPFTSLPAQIGDLTNLTLLSLRKNLLTALPPQIGNLTNLTRVDFSNSKLTTLPPEIGNLTKMDILDAGSTPIESLPVEIGNLSMMRLFRMTFNDLQGDITAPFAALRAGAPGLANLFLATTDTCPTVSDPSLAVWLDSFNSGWDRGCS